MSHSFNYRFYFCTRRHCLTTRLMAQPAFQFFDEEVLHAH